MTLKNKVLTAAATACLVGATLMLAPTAFAQGATGAQGSPGGAGTGGASGTGTPMTSKSAPGTTSGSDKAVKADDTKTGPGNSRGAGTLAGTAK